MSLTSETNRNDYVGTGALTEYDYTFRIFSSSHLLVTTRTSAGVESTLVLNTDYTVDGVGDSGGGSITLTTALATGTELTIRRFLPLTQTTDIRNQGEFYPETHEDAFDRGVMIDQQQQDEIDRSLKVPENEDTIAALPSATDRASNYLGFDANGDPIAVAAAASTTNVSAYMLTVLDDADSATARATLGIGTQDIVYSANKGPVVMTPDGLHTWRIGVDNDGNLTTTQVS